MALRRHLHPLDRAAVRCAAPGPEKASHTVAPRLRVGNPAPLIPADQMQTVVVQDLEPLDARMDADDVLELRRHPAPDRLYAPEVRQDRVRRPNF